MRKFLLVGAAVLSLGMAAPAYAASAGAVGAAAGATTGGTLGFLFGGPIGAIIGGFSGAAIGGTVSQDAVTYAGNHPVDEVYISGDLGVGYHVGDHVHVYPIEGDSAHGYFYANNRVWIVDRDSGEVVASPGFVVSQKAVAYAKAHPTTSITVSGDLEPGVTIDGNVHIASIPGVRGYGYVYVGDAPALIDTGSRTVVWVE